ncbi:hypothetical protein [Ferrimonas marina]|uniref:Uncharacterized protein n=1 Tax=Ferrimonas marina TaxID=299255 RepID=A0A1M5TCF9_9GAMM|nr:hypothetical protein [Ferrimonas marina]SHH48495.1 hypothetical protein SAMN02745129_2086 [Ferrimonas marina]
MLIPLPDFVVRRIGWVHAPIQATLSLFARLGLLVMLVAAGTANAELAGYGAVLLVLSPVIAIALRAVTKILFRRKSIDAVWRGEEQEIGRTLSDEDEDFLYQLGFTTDPK